MTAFLIPRAQYELPGARQRIEEGRREVEEAMRRWSHQGFQLPHWWEIFALGALDLYEGGDRCDRQLSARAPALAGSMLLRIQVLRVEWVHLRARGALAAALGGAPARLALRAARGLAAAMSAREDALVGRARHAGPGRRRARGGGRGPRADTARCRGALLRRLRTCASSRRRRAKARAARRGRRRGRASSRLRSA